MKKSDIVEELLMMGCDKEEISGLKLGALKEMLAEEKRGEDSLIILDKLKQDLESDDAVKVDPPPEEDASTTVDVNVNDIPEPSSPAWTQYVLGLFQDDEMDGEHPRLEGLRRVAELLLGEVSREQCELVSAPTMENGERACAKASIVFSDGRIFEALADACPSNCTKDFAIYPVAMADTRAKGRAYRAALKLKRVVSAEEIGVTKDEEVDDANKLINTGQITAIRLLSDRLGISIKKLLDDLEISSVVNNGVVDMKYLKHCEGLVVLSNLNNMRQTGHVQEKLKR
jgi:hypothetical protein